MPIRNGLSAPCSREEHAGCRLIYELNKGTLVASGVRLVDIRDSDYAGASGFSCQCFCHGASEADRVELTPETAGQLEGGS